VGNQEDAEEAVQEALARAWRAGSRATSVESPTAWLLQITRNESLRVLERRARLRRREVPEGEVAEPSAEDGRIEQFVSQAPTRQALHRLSPDERTLLLLRYGEDLTLDLPEGTVKVRLHRIRKRFVQALEECA
jgi:RNA polymerase sigma-70 factor (ECF subfamily)